MDQNQPEARPPLTKYEDLAKMIDHSLLRPELTGDQVAEGCGIARQYQVASVTVGLMVRGSRPGEIMVCRSTLAIRRATT